MRFPSFLLWLMMLAIPVQGFAAASMLYCGMGAEHQAMQTEAMPKSHHMAELAVHMDQSAGHIHVEVAQEVDHQNDQAQDMSGKLPDSTHKCGVCAACCNLIGLAEAPELRLSALSPPAQYDEPLAQSYAAPSRLLERPPRS